MTAHAKSSSSQKTTQIKPTGKLIRLNAFKGRVFSLVAFQVFSTIVLGVIAACLKAVAMGLLSLNSRPAFTSGDLPYLLHSWQGIAVLIIGVAALFIYLGFEINGSVIVSRAILTGERLRARDLFMRIFSSLRLFLNPVGLLIVLFIGLVSPLVGGTLSISITQGLSVPNFIMSVIDSKAALVALYDAVVALCALAGILYAFTFHFIVLGGMKPIAAMKASRRMFIGNFKFIIRNVIFLIVVLAAVLALVACLAALGFVAVFIAYAQDLPDFLCRTSLFLVIFLVIFLMALYTLITTGSIFAKMTLLYDACTGAQVTYKPEKKDPWKGRVIALVCAVAAVFICASCVYTANFDVLFPQVDTAQIIGHRTCGNLALENTAEGVEKAAEEGLYAAELDVQRTKDGKYVINHDDTFTRLSNDDHASYELTLDQIKKLPLANTTVQGGDPGQYSTLEEVLDAAKESGIRLYVELKGATADAQMADDVYAAIKERDMIDQCSILSLNYDELEYVEDNYPQIDTVYLIFAGFGNLQDLKCDGLAMEEELAQTEVIQSAKAAGKRVDIWTCDSRVGLESFMASDADGIITDEIEMAKSVKSEYDEGEKDKDFSDIIRVQAQLGDVIY